MAVEHGAAADALPFLDEHALDVAADVPTAWSAALATFESALTRPAAGAAGRLLGCRPAAAVGGLVPGGTLPGFSVTTMEPPRLVVLEGRHRFARYAIVLRVEPAPVGARVRLESRAAFPGPHGSAYRLLLMGSRGHVVAVRRLLASVRRRAEQPPR